MIFRHHVWAAVCAASAAVQTTGCVGDADAPRGGDLAPDAGPSRGGVDIAPRLPEKRVASPPLTAVPAASSWTVGLVASNRAPWAVTPTTLTATTNMDVGPTPYYIQIWDPEAGEYLASCGAGTTCSASATRSNMDIASFKAMVVQPGSPPLAAAAEVVNWHVANMSMVASETTLPVGAAATLTAATDLDIATSPSYVQIYDEGDTTGTLLQRCGTGTRCTVTVGQTIASTHRYRACLSDASASYPPPNVLECTPLSYVTWSDAGITMSLTATATAVAATSSIDVSQTPYAIQIFNITGELIAACRTGTTCATEFTSPDDGSYLIGLVGPPDIIPSTSTAAASSLTLDASYFGSRSRCQGAPIGNRPHPHPSRDPPACALNHPLLVPVLQAGR